MRKLLYIFLFLILVGCEKKTEWLLQSKDPGFIVVEGGITDEPKAHSVTLSYPVTDLNGIPEPISGAVVSISDGSTTLMLNESDSLKGTYVTDANVAGIAGRTYALNIDINDKSYTAIDYMPATTWFSPLKYGKSGDSDLYQITWIANAYNPITPAMYEILIDWSHVPGFENGDSINNHATLYYFTLTSIDVSEIFQPEIEKIYFPAGATITERKYSLSPAHESFIRCLLLETSWRGGLFDAISANVPSNVSNGALGFFSASSVLSLSVTVMP